MPILFSFSFIIQVLFAIHAIKTGRDMRWVYLIVLFPGVGCAVYFFVEILPDLRQSHAARQAAKALRKTLDPQRDLREMAKNLRISDNVDNKLNLAGECVTQGLYDEAAQLYESALRGLYKNDPAILEKLAHCRFLQGQYTEAKNILDQLISLNPDYKSAQGHLLYARVLESLGEEKAALEEYQVLADYYPGAEAKCRYALLLRRSGHTETARRLFQQLIDTASDAPAFYRQSQKEWLDIARQHLKG